MYRISETNISLTPLQTNDDQDSSLNSLWNTLESNFSKTLPFIEDTIEKWNSRTKLISNLAQGAGNSKKSSVFNATIVEQVKGLMSSEESMKRLVQKTRAKRDTYRVMGRGAEDLHQTEDADIYNDHDFYQVLLSDFL